MRISASKRKIIKIMQEIEKKLEYHPIADLLEEYKIPRATYYTWRRRYIEYKNTCKVEDMVNMADGLNTKETYLLTFETDDKEIGSRIRKIRESMNLSITQFISGSIYTQAQMTYFESGQRKINIHFLTLLFLKYGINPNYILLNQEPQFIFTGYKENTIKKNNFKKKFF
ncbi:helix-turn-helix domain-containing protein [Campylobacter lari]|uniref:helix-turn-helix domain-containing protein n=1 Tax=Campylobacter lari TaxID=201 RepID=UPI00397BF397